MEFGVVSRGKKNSLLFLPLFYAFNSKLHCHQKKAVPGSSFVAVGLLDLLSVIFKRFV
jgi:hypothetical protein